MRFTQQLHIDVAVAGQSVGRATPVGFYPSGATPEGLLDMAGNVFEWCLDCCSTDNAGRVVRGSCYRSVELFVRPAFQGRFPADDRKDFLGFRLCRSLAQPNRE